MTIDINYRRSWIISKTHRGHSVWTPNTSSPDEIHGTIVGIHIASCNGCLKCIKACPTNVFEKWNHEDIGPIVDPVSEQDCILCFLCEIACPMDAIHIQRKGGSEETLESLLRGV